MRSLAKADGCDVGSGTAAWLQAGKIPELGSQEVSWDCFHRQGALTHTICTAWASGATAGRAYLVGAPAAHPVEVVGLVEDCKYLSLREENLPTVFLAKEPSDLGHRDTLELRTAIPPSRLIVPVLTAVAEVMLRLRNATIA